MGERTLGLVARAYRSSDFRNQSEIAGLFCVVVRSLYKMDIDAILRIIS